MTVERSNAKNHFGKSLAITFFATLFSIVRYAKNGSILDNLILLIGLIALVGAVVLLPINFVSGVLALATLFTTALLLALIIALPNYYQAKKDFDATLMI